MSPTPIPPSVVHIILQYIAPPSELLQPLPPHLLSRSLLQRHHFLQLSPDDLQQYLCWPSSPEQQSRAIAFLESLPRPIHDDEPVAHPVQYTSDGEYIYAHIDLSTQQVHGARLIFQWDGLGEWKYHDANLMPFPPDSHPILQNVAGSSLSTHDAQLVVPSTYREVHSYRHLDGEDAHDTDDDNYWNAYGSHDDDFHGANAQSLSGKDTGGETEDAYWARYSSVHGTADSTQPSPLPEPYRKSHAVHQERSTEDQSAHPLPLSAIPRPNLHSRWDPASPRVLAELLSKISPRPSPSSSLTPAPELAVLFGSKITSPTVGGSIDSNDSDTPGPALAVRETEFARGLALKHEEATRQARPAPELKLDDAPAGRFAVKQIGRGDVDNDDAEGAISADEEALKAGVEGLWRLWKAGRRRRESPGEDDGEVFMRVVQNVVGRT